MEFLVLTKVGGILGPFATVLGFIINAIYEFLEMIGIPNIGLAIILFTLIVNLLLLPLTIKQQKSSKMMAVMNPELQKIQAKYKGKRDEVSVRRMQAETSAVYQKYGSSPTGGCLYMLIQLPILFALYQVIYAVPAYVNSLNDLYMQIAEPISRVSNGGEIVTGLINDLGVRVTSFDFSNMNKIVDFLYNLRFTDFPAVSDAFSAAPDVVNAIAAYTPEIEHVNSFIGGLNIANTPTAAGWWPGALIPILSGVTQYASVKISQASQPQANSDENPMAGSMKMMNVMMPLFSVFIGFSFQVGIGIYWIASAVFRTITMVLANKMIDKKGLDKIIEENKAKAKKKAEKRGDKPSKFEEYAKMSTKNFEEVQKRKSIKEIANTSTEKLGSAVDNKKQSPAKVNQPSVSSNEDSNSKHKKGKKGEPENANIANIANMLKDKNYNNKNKK